jgi:cytosine/adenosine deaminase-related metal-dependent hydrolase
MVRGERIEHVGTTATLPVPPGYEHISTEGTAVLPGLWNRHVHLITPRRELLRQTSV